MLSNLLSGAVGALVGGVAAFVAAVITISRTRDNQAALSRRQHAIQVSGQVAYALVTFYEELRRMTAQGVADEERVGVERLRDAEGNLRRSIIIDAPLLDARLERKMKPIRDEVRRVLPPNSRDAEVGELRKLLVEVRSAGDDLRELRRKHFAAAPEGTRLT
ncbi:MAG: hypothetical protein ACR2P2_10855 [Nakamurella sp.]